MAGVITTGNNPKLLWPGLEALFGTTYAELQMVAPQVFDVRSSDKLYEEIQELTGFGLASVKTEASAIVYTSTTQGPTARFTNVVYGLGFEETEESVEDNQYKNRATDKTRYLARSMVHTKETVCANIYNRAFSNSYLGADNVRLISPSHVTQVGNQSNTLTTDADLSEASLEDMVINMRNATDSVGLRINLMPRKLVIPPNEMFNATRILKSTGQNDTANNATNALRAMGYLDTIINWPFLTDNDAWFITSDIDNGLILYNRRAVSFVKDSDFDTGNYKHKATERYVPGWADWRGLWGSQGA